MGRFIFVTPYVVWTC